jgi:serine/threonine protein kinase
MIPMANQNNKELREFEDRFKEKEWELIGSGGFAEVYKAFDHAKHHYIAIKVAPVKPQYQQFTLQREVELVNKLSPHPNIARYDACYRFDFGIGGSTTPS